MKYLCVHCGVMLEKTSMILLPKSDGILNDWIRQYKLQIPTSKGGDQFVCKTHLAERRVPERVSLKSYPEQPSISGDIMQDVKLEEVYQTEEYGNGWEEPQLQAVKEEDYGMGFEMEESSYETYEAEEERNYDQRSIEMERPSTSNSKNSPKASNTMPRMAEIVNLPLCYPELSDDQIMIFCVKRSSNISGEILFECGMCPEQYLNTGDSRPIRLHLQKKHCDIMDTFIATGQAKAAPKEYTPLSEKKINQANRKLCEFLIKNGLPLKCVRDMNLQMLCFNMNSSYTLPSEETLSEYIDMMVAEKEIKKSNIVSGPVSVTFDTTSFNNQNYLAFTVHYLQNRKKKRSIFLREFEMNEPIVSSIMCTIRNAMEEAGIRAQITSVVSGKVEHEEALDTIGSFKQVNVCFTENINKFAETLIQHPIFASTLQKLREFISKFPTNRIVWGRFKAYLIRKRTYGEYPEIDGSHWYSTLDMLTKCCHMHRLFSEFAHQSTAHVKYIAPGENVEVLYLQHLLTVIKNNMKSLLESNTTIADVIPAIMDIHKESGQTSNPLVLDTVNIIFNRLLLPFVCEADSHRFALFLHPRKYADDTVFSPKDWESIGRDISTLLAVREQRTGISITECLKSSYNEPVDKEIKDYTSSIGRVSGIEADVLDFWHRHEKRFPRLSKLAKELFLMPVFSIDASFYLGEYGLLTYTLQEMEASKQKTLLLASSDLVDFRSKGNVMCKTICVKRKKENTHHDDLWYTPIDLKALQVGEPRPIDTSRPPRFPTTLTAPLNKRSSISSLPPRRPQLFHPPRTTFKQELAKIQRPAQPQRMYAVANRPAPYPRPMYIPQRHVPQTLVEPKNEPMVEVKQEQVTMSPSTSEKKFYPVRVMPGTTQRVIKTIDGKLMRLNRPRVPISTISFSNGDASTNPDPNKKYFVRTRTGGVTQIQRPPLL